MSLYKIGNRIGRGMKNLIIDEEEALLRETNKLEREARIRRMRANIASMKATKRAESADE